MAEKSNINQVRIVGAISIVAVVGAVLIAIYRTGETMACQPDAHGTAANIPRNLIQQC